MNITILIEICTQVFRNNGELKKAEAAAHDRVCVGTTVVVEGFLCGQPVRQARIRPTIELEQIRLYLVAQAIVHHKVSMVNYILYNLFILFLTGFKLLTFAIRNK